MADRPRRSARQPIRIPVIQTEERRVSHDDATLPSQSAKRKIPKPIDPQIQLRNLLENPKSILTMTDTSVRVTNQQMTWNEIPPCTWWIGWFHSSMHLIRNCSMSQPGICSPTIPSKHSWTYCHLTQLLRTYLTLSIWEMELFPEGN